MFAETHPWSLYSFLAHLISSNKAIVIQHAHHHASMILFQGFEKLLN